jgi:aspartyl-tRNA synthetase
MAERAHRLRSEFCVQVTGEVVTRPEGNENPELPTGAIEVTTTGLTVLSESAPLPFPVDEHADVGEEIRLKHRYLDLRRSGPAAAMRLRSEVNRAAREVLHERGFVEVETPTLTHGCAPAPGTRCRRARSCSSSCSWWAGWSATSRSPAATATRTSAPTANPSSRSSTSR